MSGRRALAGDQPEDAADARADRAPGVEGPEDVAEQDAERPKPEPEGDEDEGEREVAVRRLGPLEPGLDRDAEQEHADRARRATCGSRVDDAARAAPERAPVARPRSGARRQAAESATKETIRTSEAPQANSQARDRQVLPRDERVGEREDRSALIGSAGLTG